MVEQQKPSEPAVTGEVTTWPIPTLLRRFGALMVDWLLCLLVAGLFDRFQSSWAPLVLVVEYAFFVGLFGQTPGMRLVRIACVSIVDGRPIGILPALLRGILLALLIPALLLDRQRRGWHDRAAGSIVIDARPAA